MLNFRLYALLLLTLLSVIAPLKVHAAGNNAVSENIIYLQDDGKSYLLHRTMHTDSSSYTFHIDKEYSLDDFNYISPNSFEWDTTSSDETNSLKFSQGNFAVIYPGRFNSNLKIKDKGVYLFNSWDGKRRDDGLFGYWNTPSDFTSFVYVWIVPQHFEILSYKSNRDGEWVKRDNTITFFAANTNSLAFEISYQLRDSDGDSVADTQDLCPQTPANTEVNETGCLADSDHDTIVDSQDLCPDTAANLTVNMDGCEPDTDKDGVVDRLDQCPDTAANLSVNAIGCELDSDKDGVVDRLDQCPQTAANLSVNAIGCELDSDKDGVVDRLDQCPDTAANLSVNAIGCELDSDKDGVVDRLDQCPQTAANLSVNAIGCELDSDKDGVVDRLDQCPETAANLSVDAIGCELDSDKDGVVNRLDQCPDTAANLRVNAIGCELDSDKDGVVDRLDQCPDTAANLRVNAIGCELDSDKDGVINEKDLCPDSVADATVDETGCELAAPINLKGVNFKTSSDQLLPESKLILDDVAAILAMHRGLIIEIDGHTDSAGDAENNLSLSQQRAETVRDYLISKGISADTLTARGYGETLPLEDNTTAEGRKRNRRVELKRVD